MYFEQLYILQSCKYIEIHMHLVKYIEIYNIKNMGKLKMKFKYELWGVNYFHYIILYKNVQKYMQYNTIM